jgi:CRP-like cAMP-binding protein
MRVVRNLSVIEKALLLMKMDMFQSLATDEIALIAAKATEVEFEVGEIIDDESDYGTSAIMVTRGAIEQWRGQVLIRRARAEMAVGLYGLMGVREVGTHVMRVTEPTHAIVLSQHDFFTALADHPEFAVAMIRGLARLILNFEKRIEALEKAARP